MKEEEDDEIRCRSNDICFESDRPWVTLKPALPKDSLDLP